MNSAEGNQQSALVKAFAWIIVAYVVATIVGFVAGYGFLPDEHPLVAIAIADTAATIAIFLFSYIFRNTSFYDAYWSVAPIPILAYLTSIGFETGAHFGRIVLVNLLVLFWGIRLTYNWARSWKGLKHEDWRYVDMQRQTGPWYWLVSLFGLHYFPTVLVYLGCLALYPAVADSQDPLTWKDLLAAIVTFSAIMIEWRADEQLYTYRRVNPGTRRSIDTGLWAYSRHPNYFGEMSFWWGIFLFGWAADPGWWWTIVGPICMTLLFVFISIPMMEKRLMEKREDYAEVKRRVSMLIPWKRKKE